MVGCLQAIDGEPHSGADERSAEGSGHDRACETAAAFGGGEFYANDEDEAVQQHHRMKQGGSEGNDKKKTKSKECLLCKGPTSATLCVQIVIAVINTCDTQGCSMHMKRNKGVGNSIFDQLTWRITHGDVVDVVVFMIIWRR